MAFLSAASACGPVKTPEPKEGELTVFAAASLSDVLQEVGRVYQRRLGVDLVFNFAGSNLLAQQILTSSSADVFLSADEEWMNVLDRAGRVQSETRRALLSNTLAVIAHAGSPWEVKIATDLCGLDFRFLSLGNPEYVPAGRYAREWLQTLSCDGRSLWDVSAGRLSPAPDVRAVLGQVEAVAGVIGIVYQTDYAVARDHVELLHAIPASEGPTIRYWVSQMSEAPHPKAALFFLEFLYSDISEAIFKKQGFVFVAD